MQHWNDNGRVSLKVTYFPAFGALRDVLWNVLLRFSIARGGALEHFLHIALNFGRRIIPQIKDVIIILDKSKVQLELGRLQFDRDFPIHFGRAPACSRPVREARFGEQGLKCAGSALRGGRARAAL